MDAVPVIQTERLVMRGWKDEDFAAYAAANADPDVQRFLGGPQGREESWRSFAVQIGHWHLRGYGQWALERRADCRLVGRAGLWHPEGWFGLELGWKLHREAWGHGYATEAAVASLAWAWSNVHADRIISVIHPENAASLRVAERLGMYHLRDDTDEGSRVVIMTIDRPGRCERSPRRGFVRPP